MFRAKFGIHFGALAPKIGEQLTKQGVDWSGAASELTHIQRDADALARLAVRGYIPGGQRRQLHKKLIKRIDEALSEHKT